MQQRPPSLLGAAAVQAADAVIVLVASVLAGIDTVAGRSYQEGSGIALTLIGIGTAVALAWVALGLSRARRWSRTPTALTQLFVGIVSVYLLQGHRYAWGVPLLLLACAGMALLLVPASLRALAAPPHGGGPAPQAPPQAKASAGQNGPGHIGTSQNGIGQEPAARQDLLSEGPPGQTQASRQTPRPRLTRRRGGARRRRVPSEPAINPAPWQPKCIRKRPSGGLRRGRPPEASSSARRGPPEAGPSEPAINPAPAQPKCTRKRASGGSGGSPPRVAELSRRRSGRPGAGRASGRAAGTRASARSPARWRSATGSCCRRTAAAGCAFPGWAAVPARA